MLRQKTPVEEQRFRSYFKNFNINKAFVTGEASLAYNSISWSVGLTRQWLWPGNSLDEFDRFYRKFGYERADKGSIAVWGLSQREPTHASVVLEPHNSLWESKCGADLRIQHNLNEFAGNVYGKIIAYYTQTHPPSQQSMAIIEQARHMERTLDKPELIAIRECAALQPKKILLDFEKSFEAWRNTWFVGRLAINSNPLARTGSYEFFRLVKMGEAIVPFVILKLTDRDNFFALQLYDRVQKNRDLIVQDSPEHPAFLEGEQGKAYKTVKVFLNSLLPGAEKSLS